MGKLRSAPETNEPNIVEAPEGNPSGALFVVGTPIGNLEDITLRALDTLKSADLIAAEDTRVTRKLLSRYDIHTPMTSYNQHSGGSKAAVLAGEIEKGRRIALVSDAGMPGISDPGWELIRGCIEKGLEVVPVPGPTAAIAALAVAGLPTQRFAFDGFPPRQKKNRVVFFGRLRYERRTVVLYESPRRLRETLHDLMAVVGPDRRIVIGRELTKIHEEWIRGDLRSITERISEITPRGEFVIVVEGSPADDKAPQVPAEIDIEDGLSTRDLTERLVALGHTRRDAYRIALTRKEDGNRQRSDS